MVGADRDRIPQAQGAAGAAQGARPVDLIAGEERRADAGGVRPGEHRRGLGWLGGEGQLPGHPGQFAPLLVGCPGFGQVQGAVDDGVPAAGGKGEVDGDLAQADPAQGAGVLGCGTGRVGGGLRIAGLIGDQHCVAVVGLCHRPGRRRVQHGPLVPGGAREQVLQPVRSCVADRFGQRPAVHVLQFHQQAPGQLPEGGARLAAGKAAGQPAEQVLGQLPVPGMRYRWRGGRRVLNLSHIWS